MKVTTRTRITRIMADTELTVCSSGTWWMQTWRHDHGHDIHLCLIFHLMIHANADHTGLPEASDHGGGLGGREELEAGDEGRVGVPDALHSGEVV